MKNLHYFSTIRIKKELFLLYRLLFNSHGYNIARLALERYKKNGPAIAICEIDDIVEPELVSLLEKEIPNMDKIRMVQTE